MEAFCPPHYPDIRSKKRLHAALSEFELSPKEELQKTAEVAERNFASLSR